MAYNNRRQPDRQRPPQQQQQQQHYDEPYYEGDHYDEQLNQPPTTRSQGYNEYQDQNYVDPRYQSHDQQYVHNEQWQNSQNQRQQFQDQYNQRPPQSGRGPPRQQRPYQYDDRYRVNGPSRQPHQTGSNRPPPRAVGRPPQPSNRQFRDVRAGDMGYGQPPIDIQNPRVRERILGEQPESPKVASWDNPFPVFPTKKKQAEGKSSESANDADIADIARPSTSHSNRQGIESSRMDIPRPHTSNSQRNFEPLRGPSEAPPMPTFHNMQEPQLRNQPSLPRMASDQTGQSRPMPRRAVTGPAPGQTWEDHGHPNQQSQEDERNERSISGNYQSQRSWEEPNYRNAPPQNRMNRSDQPRASPQYHAQEREFRNPPLMRNIPNDMGYRKPTQQHDTRSLSDYPESSQVQMMPSGPGIDMHNIRGHRRQSSDQSYRENQQVESDNYDTSSYRGIPLTKKLSPDQPVYDLAANTKTERIEDAPDRSPPQLANGPVYNKPTYQKLPSPEIGSYSQPSTSNIENLVSPLAQFSFNLDASKSPEPFRTTSQTSMSATNQEGLQHYQSSARQGAPGQGQHNQHPQRVASRPQDFGYGNSQGYPPPRQYQYRPGLAPPAQANAGHVRDLEDDEFDRPGYDSRLAQGDGYDRRMMASSQTPYGNEAPRQNLDQRIQPRPGLPFSQQVQSRPSTSNSGQVGPPMSHGSRGSFESQRYNGMQNPDSLPAHPAPFRPGLMQQTPPAPRPTPPPQQPQPQAQANIPPPAPQAAAIVEAPVTVQELSTLRESYKANPSDFALGLRFAKRLVEAAKVLASENGRADQKQTAKNRERYVIDAHKIVKRLCNSGYVEAMFYLADCYGQGLLGLECDPKEAFSLYQSAAKLGHAQAAYRVAVCCELGAEEGGGTRRDPLKAVQWYKRAASLGDTPAMYKMGMIQLKGLLGQSKSTREGISWLKRAAERADAENPHALHELGLLYENAQSTDVILKDEKYALQLFQQAAEFGYKYSQFRLGSAYEYGMLGLHIDPRMSIAWYSRAAKQSEHQSEIALSGWYLTGSGQSSPSEQPLLQQSDTEAYLWARKAASSGLAKAEYAMGYFTEAGIGVAPNIEEAKRWYYRAAAQNDIRARERLEDLKKGGQRMQKTRVSRSNVGKHNEGECTVM